MEKEKQDFKVSESVINGKWKKCVLCEKDFKLGEDIILQPLQEPREGYANVECIILHKKCCWIEKEESETKNSSQ